MDDKSSPDYKKIYTDIIHDKYPHKLELCSGFLAKRSLTSIDIIQLNTLIFGESKLISGKNQKHKVYTKEDILYMLEFQRKNNLNNNELANYFKLSRNTVTKWRKMFSINYNE